MILKDLSPMSSILPLRPRKGLFKCLHYNNAVVQLYLVVVSLLCIYGDVYNAGFQDNRMLLILVLYLLDLGFCLKFLIPYAMPYIAEKDDDARRVLLDDRQRYYNYEFKFDILSCAPLELLSFLSYNHRAMLFSLFRLNRLFRVITVYKGVSRHHERLSINITLMTIYSVFVWSTLFVHVTTCLWYFMGHIQDKAQPKSSWIYKNDGSSWCDNLYICSLYFVLTTFTQNGVGDIMPKNRAEVLFVSVLQVISTMVFMIYVGEFSNIIQYQSYRSFGFYSKYLELQEFLKNNRVSSNLVKLVNKYSLHLWRESRGVQVPHFLKAAPHCLRLRLMSAAFGHHLTNNSVFKNCEAAFLRQLVGCLRLYTYNKGMFVVRESEITDSMYLIHTGRVEESKDEDNQKKTFYTGDFFGMLQGTTHELPYMHSYCTLTKCQILTLNLNDWEELLKHFPASKNTIYRNLYLDGSPPNPIKGKKDTKGKKVRKVAIINSYNEDSSDYISDKATEPMITSPTEHKYTESEPIDNLEEVSSLPSEEFVSILISESAASNLISEKVKLEQISGSPDNRSKLDKSNTPKEIDNQEISNKSSKGQDNTIPTIASIITLQGTKDTTFSNFTIISTGSTNADSLLQLEDEEITSDLIAKLDRVNKPTASTSNDYETSETDKQNLKELKYAETDADKKISGYEMKTVEEYIFERQELDESISLEQQQAKFSPERKEPVNLPTSSRTNRYLYRVRYQDDNSKDASPNESITKEGKGRKEGSPDDTSSNEMKIMSPDSETTDDPKEKNENTKSGNERKNMKQSKKKDD